MHRGVTGRFILRFCTQLLPWNAATKHYSINKKLALWLVITYLETEKERSLLKNTLMPRSLFIPLLFSQLLVCLSLLGIPTCTHTHSHTLTLTSAFFPPVTVETHEWMSHHYSPSLSPSQGQKPKPTHSADRPTIFRIDWWFLSRLVCRLRWSIVCRRPVKSPATAFVSLPSHYPIDTVTDDLSFIADDQSKSFLMEFNSCSTV